MRKLCWKLIALALVLAMLLSGCAALESVGEWFTRTMIQTTMTAFSDMEYTRPDIDRLEEMAQSCEEAAEEETNPRRLAEQVWTFYGEHNAYYTNYNLASIRYYQDVTDIYWEQEYTYCMENASALQAALDQLHYALAESPLREQLEADHLFGEGYFDDYTGESIWDEAFTQLMEQEAQLISEYNTLSSFMPQSYEGIFAYYETYGQQILQVMAQLVALRQEIGRQAGYDDYVQFAYDFYYYRDYTPQQAAQYCEQIREHLVPLYRQLSEKNYWSTLQGVCTESETYTYVRDMADAMGGTMKDAFLVMETLELADTAYSSNKYNISFEVFLNGYGVPFLFVNPTGWDRDKLTFAHEFGHFCNDYASNGSQAGVDVKEVFSQGMEYMSLCYGRMEPETAKLKMADSLSTYVEQAAYAAFEQQLYSLEGEDLSAEGIVRLYDRIAREYGFDARGYDPRELVEIVHFFLYPQYVISYVVSNDAALQLYQMEQNQTGTGLQALEQSLTTQQSYFLAFVHEAGLESPFVPGRIESVKKTMTQVLQ